MEPLGILQIRREEAGRMIGIPYYQRVGFQQVGQALAIRQRPEGSPGFGFPGP